ncbi:MAG: Gfo/Idh/MocA family oxidoreductase [Verrucomicrobiae bacterium]|nr:Gfo/Idh/MocA family oxidoreductase [Verrucomicrobiae bacterium]MDW7979256.1 Gfo/Idh/MocA family oxidoreductase [Verrucomicrobiales bacterium]
MNYAIIGCGLIGKKRLAALPHGSRLVVACDINPSRAEELVRSAGTGRAVSDYLDAVTDPQVEAVIVATANAALADIAAAAIRAHKHVLVEKPGAISVRQIDELITLQQKHRVCVRVGFNHRFHPAVRKAREIFDSGAIGKLMFIRARYGHGGRLGYEKEWRADPKLSGGGELIDQGTHLIDLARWFLGTFEHVEGHIATYFWQMPVEDNAFLCLRTAQGQTAWLHASWTEWKNTFSFEIFGRTGKLHIEGLGGSYGTERLYHYQMKPELGPPETLIYEFPGPDVSWALELAEFEHCIRLAQTETQRSKRTHTRTHLTASTQSQYVGAALHDARATIAVVEAIYQKANAQKRKKRKETLQTNRPD